MKPQVCDLLLNAFADGEVSSSEAARIAAVIATDPATAQRVAYLHQLKAALSAIPETIVLPEPSKPDAHVKAKGDLRTVRALVSGLVLLIALFWSAPVSGPSHQDPNLWLLAYHDQWALNDGALNDAFVLPKALDWLHPPMQASGLQLVYSNQNGARQHLGFKGVNACRLSLFISQSAGPASALYLSLTPQVQHAHWQTGTTEFEMLARDMAPARFATIATSLHRESREHIADAAFQMALLQAARLPCTA